MIFEIMKKRIFAVAAALCLLAGTGAFAQDSKKAPMMKERPTAEQMAQRRTERMTEKLNLSEKQSKQLYEVNLQDIKEMQESPLVLITNGLFSLSFIIAIILCMVGFLIYWITSIKQRELLFGIYRAMGMSMHEINKMLINEQIFSSVLASLAGYGVGAAATILFVKLVAVVYLPEAHNIAISIAVDPYDLIKLTAVVIFMFIVCFIVIRTILKKMNITQALKLGED